MVIDAVRILHAILKKQSKACLIWRAVTLCIELHTEAVPSTFNRDSCSVRSGLPAMLEICPYFL
jgi:hypothetical protein